MSILNRTNDGLFNVLIVLHRTLSEYGPMGRDRLLALCRAGPDDDGKMRSDTLLRWTQLGLFKVSDGGEITLDKGDRDPNELRSLCRRLLFSEDNNQRFWDSEGSRAADFTRAASFILAQDIYAHGFGSHPEIEVLEQKQVRDETRRILQNNTRWNGLTSWGDYLGLFWVDQRRWPDPTAALREELRAIFGTRKELPATEFISQVARQLPVLDEGHYRVQVEEILDPSEWQRPARSDLLSTSLSRALWRLSQPGGPLRLEKRSDAGEAKTLQRSGGREWAPFTHVLLTGDMQ